MRISLALQVIDPSELFDLEGATLIVAELQKLPATHVSKRLIGKAFRKLNANSMGGKVPRQKLIAFVMKHQPKRMWRILKFLRIDKVLALAHLIARLPAASLFSSPLARQHG
jgi:hypothetical protein